MWAAMRENLSFGGLRQHRGRPACASMQSDQCFCYFPFAKYHISTCTGEIWIFYLVSVAEKFGLKLTLSETQKTGFLATLPIRIQPMKL